MFSLQPTVLVLGASGLSGDITKSAAASGIMSGVLRWDVKAKAFRINKPFTWNDVDALR